MLDQIKAPEARLASLLDDLFSGGVITPDVREWLIKGLFHYLQHGGAEPLDRFLGLSPINAGERSLSTRLALLKRDVLLADAVDQIALDASVTDWTRCVRLAKEISFFSSNTWPIYRSQYMPNSSWSAWKKSLFLAFQVGIRIPTTARSLYEIRKQVRVNSFQSPRVKLLTSLTRIQTNEKVLVLTESARG